MPFPANSPHRHAAGKIGFGSKAGSLANLLTIILPEAWLSCVPGKEKALAGLHSPAWDFRPIGPEICRSSNFRRRCDSLPQRYVARFEIGSRRSALHISCYSTVYDTSAIPQT